MLKRNSMDEKIDQILKQYNFHENQFFIELDNGEMSKERFVSTQYQFYYAVINFTSPLALVAAAIPNYLDRVNIIKNLWEEHGEGDLTQTHGETFTELLRRLTGEHHIVHRQPEEAVVLFNQTLDGICKNSHFLKGVATIGMIERMFSDISGFIGCSIVKRGWMEESQMIHYSVHKDLDVIHAEDFFSILRHHMNNENMPIIEEGLRLGALTFHQLYHNLAMREKSR